MKVSQIKTYKTSNIKSHVKDINGVIYLERIVVDLVDKKGYSWMMAKMEQPSISSLKKII